MYMQKVNIKMDHLHVYMKKTIVLVNLLLNIVDKRIHFPFLPFPLQ